MRGKERGKREERERKEKETTKGEWGEGKYKVSIKYIERRSERYIERKGAREIERKWRNEKHIDRRRNREEERKRERERHIYIYMYTGCCPKNRPKNRFAGSILLFRNTLFLRVFKGKRPKNRPKIRAMRLKTAASVKFESKHAKSLGQHQNKSKEKKNPI